MVDELEDLNMPRNVYRNASIVTGVKHAMPETLRLNIISA